MLFSITRRALFLASPETAHDVAMIALDGADKLGLMRFTPSPIEAPVELLGLTFRNRVGLAAGLDKNADHVPGLARLGFGFIEVGTVTPRAQPGNTPPRLFRLPAREALINRMGFNNKGVAHLVKRLQKLPARDIPIGINIGKNRDTGNDGALQDYLACLSAVYPYADYVTVNISSPNTPGLRDLQAGQALQTLVTGLIQARAKLADETGRWVPMLVKIAPDIDSAPLAELADTLMQAEIDGIIATNTTLSREGVEHLRHASEAGGLSGGPLTEKSTTIIQQLRQCVGGAAVIIAAGGILTAQDAVDKVNAGADLVQIYTGLIYRGPRLITDSAKLLSNMACESLHSSSK